jgi:hypothetical protein
VLTIGLVLAAVVAVTASVAQTAERLEIGAGLLVDRPSSGPPVTQLDVEVARLSAARHGSISGSMAPPSARPTTAPRPR